MDGPHLLFDLNGTLTDPAAIGSPWKSPELGYEVLALAVHTAMVDTILSRFRAFSEHIEGAVRALAADRKLDPSAVGEAIERAASLPLFPDTASGLAALTAAGFSLAVLTNSGEEAGRRTLRAAGVESRFERVLGVDAVQRFKPHPATYEYALRELGRRPGEVTFVTAHAWDLAGAAHAGMRTVLVRRREPRSAALLAPDLEAPDLTNLPRLLL